MKCIIQYECSAHIVIFVFFSILFYYIYYPHTSRGSMVSRVCKICHIVVLFYVYILEILIFMYFSSLTVDFCRSRFDLTCLITISANFFSNFWAPGRRRSCECYERTESCLSYPRFGLIVKSHRLCYMETTFY